MVASAVLCSAMAYVGAPQPSWPSQNATPMAVFDPGKAAKPAITAGGTGAPAKLAPPSGKNDSNDQLAPELPSTGTQATSRPLSTPSLPLSRSTAVWSNSGGAVSGAGLIAAYCCAGASSTVRADRSVSSGRHYWELTLSVRPGEQSPDTWTNAGVTAEANDPGPRQARIRPAAISTNGGSSSLTAIGWGQQRIYRNGDVFMFALDADHGLVYYGLNGQWQNGRPGESGGNPVGSPGGNFTPFVTISASSAKSGPEGDRWIANFGGSSYKYPIPAGFSAYGTGVAAQSISTAISTRVAAQQSPAGMQPVPQTLLYRVFEDEVLISGQRIPLPPGRWLALAHFRGQASSRQGDSVVLGRIDKGRTTGLVAINAYFGASQGNGFPAFKGCDRSDYVHFSRLANEAFGTQRCWWINHATQVWDQPLFRAAKSVLEERGGTVPPTLVNVGFRRADSSGFTTAFYYFNPEESGISSQPAPWYMSEWHKDRISLDARRVDYIKELRNWGSSWAPIFYAMASK